MHELLGYLNERGVATMLVAAQHGMMGRRWSRRSTSATWPTASCCCASSRRAGMVRKAISVMKKRTGGHENDDSRVGDRAGARPGGRAAARSSRAC